jgi:hypothetical protein
LRNEINPMVAGIVVVVIVVIVGIVLWTQTAGKTFTKDQVRGGETGGISLKMGK